MTIYLSTARTLSMYVNIIFLLFISGIVANKVSFTRAN